MTTNKEYTFYAFAIYDSGDEVYGDPLTFTPTIGVTTYEVVFTPSSKSAVTLSGDKTGISATYSNTYNNANQITGSNSCTLTISGLSGKKIVGASVSMKSNKSTGKGSLSLTTDGNEIASIADSNFSSANWNGSWSQSYVDIDLDVTETTVGSAKTVVLVIECSTSSLYFGSLTLEYQ